MTLTVATWNCADGFARKAGFLDEFPADLVCVQELREPAFAAEAHRWRHAFFARSQTARGVAVFSNLPATIFPMRYRRTDRAYVAVNVQASGQTLALLGAWVKPAENYVTPSHRVFRQFLRKLTGPAVILGDLNQNACFDANRRSGLFSDTAGMMRRAGLRSLYHEATGDAFGAERPTHWLTYSPERPYHLDYIWASADLALEGFTLYPEDPWLTERRSDHLPMRATLSLPANPDRTAP